MQNNVMSIGVGTGGAGGAIAPPLFLRLVAGFAKAYILSTTNAMDALILMLTTHKTSNLTTILLVFTFVSTANFIKCNQTDRVHELYFELIRGGAKNFRARFARISLAPPPSKNFLHL